VRVRILLPAALALLCAGPLAAGEARAETAIYAGGPLYDQGPAVLDDLRGSGFDTVVAWTLHVFPAAELVRPGLWCRHGSGCAEGADPEAVAGAFAGWKAQGVRGGFLWLYDDLLRCRDQASPGAARDTAAYARALAGQSMDRWSGARIPNPHFPSSRARMASRAVSRSRKKVPPRSIPRAISFRPPGVAASAARWSKGSAPSAMPVTAASMEAV